MRLLLSLGFLAVAALPATADEVVLRNGAVFEGIVHETGDRVVVKMAVGEMSFKKIDVKAIRKSEDSLSVYEKRAAETATAEAHYELGTWAREKGLMKQAEAQFEKAIERDPEHGAARRALGYEKHEGKWVRFDDLMVSKGFVKVGNGWQPKELVEAERTRESQERLQLSRFELEARARLAADHLERERLSLDRRALETQKELEMQKVWLERERLDILKRQDGHRVWDPYSWNYCPPFSWAPSSTWPPKGPGTSAIPPARTSPHHPGHGRPRPVPTGPSPLWTPPVR